MKYEMTLNALVTTGLFLAAATSPHAQISEATSTCLECHQETMPGLTGEWRSSKHYGADVGCYECHGADPKDTDAFEHNGFYIATIVSPKDSSRCNSTGC